MSASKIVRYLSEFQDLVLQVFRYHRVYFSWKDRARVFLLKLAATGPGRRIFSPALCFLRLRPWPAGVYLRRTGSDILVLKEIFEERIYRPVEQWNLHSQPTIVDLGGNIGLAALYFTSILPEAKIVIVEPEQANQKAIALNCAELIASGRIKVAGNFVGGRDGVASIDRAADSWAFRKIDAGATTAERIECVSMPTLMRRYGLTQIDVLKCDIEGSEAELFADCAAWIGSVNCLIVETHGSYLLKDLYAHLRQAGWNFKIEQELQAERIGLCFLQQNPGAIGIVHESVSSRLEPTPT